MDGWYMRPRLDACRKCGNVSHLVVVYAGGVEAASFIGALVMIIARLRLFVQSTRRTELAKALCGSVAVTFMVLVLLGVQSGRNWIGSP